MKVYLQRLKVIGISLVVLVIGVFSFGTIAAVLGWWLQRVS